MILSSFIIKMLIKRVFILYSSKNEGKYNLSDAVPPLYYYFLYFNFDGRNKYIFNQLLPITAERKNALVLDQSGIFLEVCLSFFFLSTSHNIIILT